MSNSHILKTFLDLHFYSLPNEWRHYWMTPAIKIHEYSQSQRVVSRQFRLFSLSKEDRYFVWGRKQLIRTGRRGIKITTPFVCSSVCLSSCLFVHSLICMFVHLYVCMFVHLSVCRFVHLHVCLFVHLSIGTFVWCFFTQKKF